MLSHVLVNPDKGEYKLYNTISKNKVNNKNTELYSFSEDLNSIKVEGGYNLDNLVKLIVDKGEESVNNNDTNGTVYVNDRLRTEGASIYLTALEGAGWYNLPIIYTVSPEGTEMSLMGNIHKIGGGKGVELLDIEKEDKELDKLYEYLDGVMMELESKFGKIYNKLAVGVLKGGL